MRWGLSMVVIGPLVAALVLLLLDVPEVPIARGAKSFQILSMMVRVGVSVSARSGCASE